MDDMNQTAMLERMDRHLIKRQVNRMTMQRIGSDHFDQNRINCHYSMKLSVTAFGQSEGIAADGRAVAHYVRIR